MQRIQHHVRSALTLAALCALGITAHAKLSTAEIERLSKDLTPVGAERAGNKDGTIPKWEGGLTKAPAGFDAKKGWADPYAADKPLFTITAANAEQYKDKLAPGQLALLKRYPSYKIDVYPTRRSAAFPDSAYEIIKRKRATYYGIAMAVTRICRAIVRDEKSVLSVSNFMQGEYGIGDVALSTPCIVGKDGVEARMPPSLNYREQAELKASADTLKQVIAGLDLK